MMLRNNVVSTTTYFYPFGNTPAVCLTQDLPPEQDASILLLGCGDIRSILFTLFAQTGQQRKLDFTCCDIEPAIIARNVLILTLIIDDNDKEKHNECLWNIYYHALINMAALQTLATRATKLLDLTTSIASWNDSVYGSIIRFCDHGSLEKVRSVWRGYTKSTDVQEQNARTQSCSDAIARAKAVREKIVGNGIILTGVRSASPAGILAFTKLVDIEKHYWETGMLYEDKKHLTNAKYPNPALFMSDNCTLTLQYGCNPLLGFHLATAFAPLQASVLRPSTTSAVQSKIFLAAQTEFAAWTDAFRKYLAGNIVIRVFCGDALAFCHTLQYIQTHPTATTANWYSNSWTFRSLTLDSGDYGSNASSAPTSFDVIDTSNLIDHLGSLNLIAATIPLLTSRTTSTLYTEILVRHEADVETMLSTLLCGNFDTMCLLLGLVVVESWTNATAAAEGDETMLDSFTQWKAKDQCEDATQVLTRIAWKLSSIVTTDVLHLAPTELCRFLCTLYKSMFSHEDPTSLMSSIKISGVQKVSNPYYNRASYAALLKLITGTVWTDWHETFNLLVEELNNGNALSVSRNFLQELYVQMYQFGLHRVDVLLRDPPKVFMRSPKGPLSKWSNIPSIVTVSLKVPFEKVSFLSELPAWEVGIPNLYCALQSAERSPNQWLNQFGVVQAGFGEFEVSKTQDGMKEQLQVLEDARGWQGKKPVIVSFQVPTWILLQDEYDTEVILGFQSTVQTLMKFVGQFGPALRVFATTLKDEDNVKITPYFPGLEGLPSINPALKSYPPNVTSSPDVTQQTQTLCLNSTCDKASTITNRLEVEGKTLMALSEKGNAVSMSQISPTSIQIHIGKAIACTAKFNRPVSATTAKLRVARKSGYVEVVALIADIGNIDSNFMFPVSIMNLPELSMTLPIRWNMPSINLSVMPDLEIRATNQLQWLTPHSSFMFSARERSIRDNFGASASYNDLRVDFKDGLFSLFMHSSNLQGGHARVFLLNRKDADGAHIIIFVSSLKLDLNTRSVAIDAAVIPLEYHIVMDPKWNDCFKIIHRKSPPACINVSEAELRLWKSILPSFVERCRDWSHNQKSCEYIMSGFVPIMSGLENAKSPLCSCGKGQLPKGYMSDLKISGLEALLKKHATRVAIPLCFSVPYIEKSFNISQEFTQSSKKDSTEHASTASMPDSKGESCAQCGAFEAVPSQSSSRALLKCARCKTVKYCSADCQKKHWKLHKVTCVAK